MQTRLGLVLILTISAFGCGQPKEYRTVPVHGVLTCRGKPVAGVQVLFSPKPGDGRGAAMPGKSAGGVTDENGKFTLSTYGLNDGAIAATHLVSVMVIEDPLHPAPAGSKKAIAPCISQVREVIVTPNMSEVVLNFGE